ncbi:tetratricopeptide repeat protein [Streptomyces sp. MBT97]|uniref:tetratricopeptide repeat protein n=1 Tax=Streptomyces sp. MBT97 TaxID=2800411 RepID=UPI00190ABD78|nr:tetratricopeptide repeat protein [Streptomyces sp. MBT97]MBK3635259.1 tetratricopeptide repeat protein [Streptomyces sp. MBT97]
MPPHQADGYVRRALPVDLDAPEADGGALTSWVLTGLGGTGKTQIAAEHAGRLLREGRLDLLLWVHAASRDAVLSAYGSAGESLFGASSGNPERTAAEFMAWLLPRPPPPGGFPRRWLVVLDDVTAPSDLRGLWPPGSPYGRTVATTRRRDAVLAADRRRTVPVGVFTTAEAVTYLSGNMAPITGSVGAEDDGRAERTALAEDLGHLPLALAHARAYLADNPTLSLAAYRTELADQRLTLAEVFPEGYAAPGDGGGVGQDPDPVARTWSLSVSRADALSPRGAARPILRTLSLLDPGGVPETVLAAPEVLALLPGADPGRPATDARTSRLALANLRRFSLAELDPARPEGAVRVHALVQRAVREEMTAEETAEFARAAADALLATWESDPLPTTEAALRSNATVLTRRARPHLLAPRPHEVLYRLGRSLGEAGRSGQAVRHFTVLADEVRNLFPDDHDLRFKTLGYLAWWTAKSGDASGGAAAFAELLAEQLRLLPAHSVDLLQTRRSAAVWKGVAGDPQGAATELAVLHEDWVRIEGHDAPGAASTRNHLANMRALAGDHAGALALHDEAWRESRSRFGADDPRTVQARAEAMRHRGELGDAPAALAAFRELAAVRERHDPDHPDTLGTRTDVAVWTGRCGDPAEAVRLLERVQADRLRVLGASHAHTLAGRELLAVWRAEAGDLPTAVAELEALVPDQLAVFGLEHPALERTTRLLAPWRTG